MVSVIQTANADVPQDELWHSVKSATILELPGLDEGKKSNAALSTSTDRHPLGIRPSGNALTSDQDLSLSMGAFAIIPDALVLLLLEYLDASSLLRISHTCKGLFGYANHDQLWRDLALSQQHFSKPWRGNWKSTLLQRPQSATARIDCTSLFSDALYRPFQCAKIGLLPFFSNIPSQNDIPVFSDLTPSQFSTGWSHKPFILRDPVKSWPVYQQWTMKSLVEKYSSVKFRAEAVDWTLSHYNEYMNDTEDESPLYLFDRAFVEKMKLTVGQDGAYTPPDCFEEDFFTLLENERPDHRWLIIGPERSGSTFHKDPNATSAWNAVVTGSKYWIMFPNHVTPPGVYVSHDQSEVTSPLSIAEWLLSFHKEARQTPGCIEGICGPGEVLHVPSGWWHLVVNLEPSIAVTQNFVPKTHLSAAVRFLRNKSDQVSGFRRSVKDPYCLFMERLKTKHPDLYEEHIAEPKKRKWEDLVKDQEDNEQARSTFTFGLEVDDDDLEEE